jgi:hypothetical protein
MSPGVDGCLISVRPVVDRWPNFGDLLLQDPDEAVPWLIRPFQNCLEAGAGRC